MSRRNFLVGLIALLALSTIGYSQTWLSLNMQPNGKTVQLAAFDGLALQPWMGFALGFVGLAGLMAIYMAPLARRVLLAMGSLVVAASGGVSAVLAISQSATAVQTQVDTALNVASAHDILPNQVGFDWSTASYSWIVLALLTLHLAIATGKSSKWTARKNIERSGPSSKAKKQATDPISLWESQR